MEHAKEKLVQALDQGRAQPQQKRKQPMDEQRWQCVNLKTKPHNSMDVDSIGRRALVVHGTRRFVFLEREY